MIHQTMGTTVISHQKNGKNSVMNGVVKLRVQNMVIVLNVRIQRKDGTKNDLPLHAAPDNLRHRCGHREVINKDMSVSLWGYDPAHCDGHYCSGNCDWCPYNVEQDIYESICDNNEIQHVSYDDAQLGREK